MDLSPSVAISLEAAEAVGDEHHAVPAVGAELGAELDAGGLGQGHDVVQEDGADAAGHDAAGHQQELQGPRLRALLDQRQADLAVGAVAVLEAGDQQQVVGGAAQGVELVVAVGVAGGVELVGAHGQLLGALQVLVARRVDDETHAEAGEELLARTLVLLLGLAALAVRLVHAAAHRRLVGDEARLEVGAGGQLGQLGSVEAAHLRQLGAHLVALERLVVDEGHGVETDVDRLGDLAHARRLRAPVDLRVEEVVRHPQLGELLPRRLGVVAAGHRVQDAAGVEGGQQLADAGAQAHLVALQQDALPQGVVEVPDQDLHGLRLGRRGGRCARFEGGRRHGQSSGSGWRGISDCRIWVLPSMISVTLASRR